MSCKCQECGRQFKIDINIPDNLWEKIKPEGKPKGSGLLCGSCIIKKLEEILDYDYFCLIKKENHESKK